MKVHCYLLYKQLDFTITYVKPYKLKSQLPTGHQVPVLSIDDQARAGSQAIGFWLDALFRQHPLLPEDPQQRRNVIDIDNWINQCMIPTVFYSIYPQLNSKFFQTVSNTWRLGRCVTATTNSALPPGLWLLWPIFIRQAGFIKQLVAPFKGVITVNEQRSMILDSFEARLSKNDYIAATARPSLADLSAWPLIALPYKLRLNNMDDFLDYPRIVQWLMRIESQLYVRTHQPALVPANLNPRPL